MVINCFARWPFGSPVRLLFSSATIYLLVAVASFVVGVDVPLVELQLELSGHLLADYLYIGAPKNDILRSVSGE